MAYPTTADLVAASSVAELTGLTEPQQDALRAAAIQAVELFAGQGFESEGTSGAPVTKKVDGSGAPTLPLPRRLSELVDVTIAESSLTEDEIELSDRHDRLVVIDPAVGNYYSRALADVSEPHFPRGPDRILVAGVWGWTDAEYDAELGAVTTALRLDMEDQARADAHALGATVTAARRLGLSTVSQGNLDLSLNDRPPDVLSPRAQRALSGQTSTTGERLIWRPAHGVVV